MCPLGASEQSARNILSAARAAGFLKVQVNFPWDTVSRAFLNGLPGWLREEGLQCQVLSAYVNCVSPEAVLMSTRREDFARALEYAPKVGAGHLIAWTGSYSAVLMRSDSRNFSRSADDAIVRFLDPYLPRLESSRLQLALETYVTLACPDALSLRRILDRLPDFVGAVLDPPNLTPPARYAERDIVLREMVRMLGNRTSIVHLKDFRLLPDGTYELPGPMKGEMNYKVFAREIAALPANVPIVAEHLRPEEFAEARRKLLTL